MHERRPRDGDGEAHPLLRAAPLLLLLVTLAACAEAPPPPAAPAPSSPPGPRASAAASAAASGAEGPAPAPSAAPIVTFAELALSGVEARLAADDLRAALPAVRACAPGGPGGGATGWLQVSFDVRADGTLGPASSVSEPPGRLPGTVQACVARAFAGVVVSGAKKPGARAALWISFAPPGTEKLPAFDADATLSRDADGACVGIVPGPDCPPHKMCEAPPRVRSRCPDGHGLPPRPDEATASRAVSVSVSGGKTGQGGEALTLYEGAGGCAARKLRTKVPSGDPLADGEEAEVVDVPCADVDAAFALAKKHFAKLRPKGSGGVSHTVHKEVGFSARASAKGALAGTKVSWTGPDTAGDERFVEVVRAAARAVKGRGRVQLGRLGE